VRRGSHEVFRGSGAQVRIAIAENRLEGIATSAATLEICEAYIRGEIEAADLVTALLQSLC
jgi:hypothetical protein